MERRKYNASERRIAERKGLAEAKVAWCKRYANASPAERERMQLRGRKR